LQIGPILHKQVHLRGIYVGSRSDFEEMNRAIALHRVQPQIDHVFAFTEAREALSRMSAAAHFGKIVIRAGQ
jgi:D-arabinose 1-dehydrogenase-like Zn-dependent alcohol dehydrogenase